MAKDFVVNHGAIRDMLNSPELQRACLEEAQAVASKAEMISPAKGAVFTADVRAGRNRAQARAKPGNNSAAWDSIRNNTLIKAAG